MILHHQEANPVEMLPGMTRRTLLYGEKVMIAEFTFLADVQLPLHNHPHEQVGYVVSGRIRMTIADQTWELGPGDSYFAPSNVPHSAYTLEPSVVIDAFSPPRQDYMG